MIEPTEGDILTVLNRYLDNGDRDTFHQILIGRAIAEIKHLRMRVADLKNGFEGSCTACEPVGEMNKKLVEERDEARWEVCGFHHLTGFLAGDYAISRGWNYFNDERKWPKFPQSVTDFDKFLKGQDKIFLEANDRLRKENEELRKERDEAWLEKGRIMNEIDCRIEHGADSNGHLEAIRKLFSKQALEKMTRLDEEMGLL